jgi:hypothetical protein
MNFEKITSKINAFHLDGKTIDAMHWILKKFNLENENLKAIELREAAKPDFILMTTEGQFGEPQILRIPENTFEFPLPLMLSLIKHEMVHVRQKTVQPYIEDKNEREWQAYYDMNFHNIYPEIVEISNFHKLFFAKKGLEYYGRMGKGSALQAKYTEQKIAVENLIASLDQK